MAAPAALGGPSQGGQPPITPQAFAKPNPSWIRITLSVLPVIGILMSFVNEIPVSKEFSELKYNNNNELAAKAIPLIDRKNQYKKFAITSVLVTIVVAGILGAGGVITGSGVALITLFCGINSLKIYCELRENEITKAKLEKRQFNDGHFQFY
jgi:hypothetical protein